MTRIRHQIVWDKGQIAKAKETKKSLFAVGFDGVAIMKGRGERLGLISEPLAALLFRFASHLYTKIDRVVSKWMKEEGYVLVYDFDGGRLGRTPVVDDDDETLEQQPVEVEWADVDHGKDSYPRPSLNRTTYGYEVAGKPFPRVPDFQVIGTTTGRFASDRPNKSNTSKPEKEPFDHHVLHVEGGTEISVLSGFEDCDDRDDAAKRLLKSGHDGVDNVFGLDISHKDRTPTVFMYTSDLMEGGTEVETKVEAPSVVKHDGGPLTADKIDRWSTAECVAYIERHELEHKLEVPTEDADLDALRKVCVDYFRLTGQP